MGGHPNRVGRDALVHLKDESVRRLHASEKAVERSFNEARLTASLAVGLVLVGFLLVAQMRGTATVSVSLERQSDQNLAFIIQQITAENATLRNEIVRMQMRIFEAGQATEDRTQVLNEAARELNSVSVAAGLEAAAGPGIVVVISDPERVLLPQDFVRMIHELRAGGAEAMAINDIRVSATSGLTGGDGRVVFEGREMSRHFQITALGEPGNLAQALELPGGLQSTLSTFPGVSVSIQADDDLRVPAADGIGFRLGTPVEDE